MAYSEARSVVTLRLSGSAGGHGYCEGLRGGLPKGGGSCFLW